MGFSFNFFAASDEMKFLHAPVSKCAQSVVPLIWTGIMAGRVCSSDFGVNAFSTGSPSLSQILV